MDKYVKYLKGQLKEIVEAYDPGILWFDGEWEKSWTAERGDDLWKYLRELSPKMIINNRIGKGRGGMSGMDTEGKGAGDYGTPEQEIPEAGFGPGVYWESCMTMNNHWGYNKLDQKWKPTKTLVYNLIDCASKGGNYLLNVGPTAEGLIPQESLDRLAEMGKWMEVNGEAVYKTSANPFAKLTGAKCTRRGDIIYLTIFDWPKDCKITLPLANKVKKAVILADGKKLDVSESDLGKVIALPAEAPDKLGTVVKITIKGDLEVKQAPAGK
jgi:alpha-L-fucosidase